MSRLTRKDEITLIMQNKPEKNNRRNFFYGKLKHKDMKQSSAFNPHTFLSKELRLGKKVVCVCVCETLFILFISLFSFLFYVETLRCVPTLNSP